MSNKIESVETRISSDPDKNNTGERSSSQGGILPQRLVDKVYGVLKDVRQSSVGYDFLYPIHEFLTNPKQALKHIGKHAPNMGLAAAEAFALGGAVAAVASAETQQSILPAGVTLLHGDGSRNRLNVLLLDWNGAPLQELQDVANDMFLLAPTDQLKDRVNVYWKRTERNLGCQQTDTNSCNWVEINKETDKVGNINATMVVAKSNDAFSGNGWSFVPGHGSQPTNHNPSVIFRPEVLPDNVRPGFAALILHELWGHQMGGFNHEGGDVMERKTNGFNFQHAQYLRALSELWPHNYYTPALRYQSGGSLLSVDQFNQLPTMELKVPPTDIPAGTKWLKIFIRQEDGPAITLVIGAPSVIDQIRNGEYKVEAPDMITGKNFILLHDQLVTASLWGTNEDSSTKPGQAPEWDSAAWTQHKAWPDLTVPSTEAKGTWRTPKSTNIIGNLTGAKIAGLTQTIRWSNSDPTAFYFEVQMSGDTRFDPNPDTATSFVYWNLVHGGQTENTWTVPDNASLAPGKYFFRVRERVQGSGTPAAWSPAFPIEIVSSTQKLEQVALLKEIYDAEIDHHVINTPTVTLKAGDIKVRFNSEDRSVPLNRAARRRLARNGLPDCMSVFQREIMPYDKAMTAHCYGIQG